MTKNTVDDYGWTSEQGPHSCDYITPRVIEILERSNVSRILDIGSGNGKLCSELSELSYVVAGIEYDIKGVEISERNYPNIRFYNYGVQDDPKHLMKNEEAFDAVISTEVIEHLFSPHLLPSYARSVLKDGGYLIITTPYHGYLKNLVLSLLNKWDSHHTPLWHGGHIKFWSRKTLKILLEESGFVELSFSGVGRVPFLWKSMVMVAKKV